MVTITKIRTARKPHVCGRGYCPHGGVRPGEKYRLWTVTPYDEAGGNSSPGFLTAAECERCAAESGRPVDGRAR